MHWFRATVLRVTVCLLLAGCEPACIAATTDNFSNMLKDWSDTSNPSGEVGYAIDVDKTVRRGKTPSAAIRTLGNDKTPGKFHCVLWQHFDAKHYKGKRVNFTGYVKRTNANGTAIPFLKAKTDNEVVKFARVEISPALETSGWHKFSVRMAVPNDATEVQLGINVTGGGTTWLSDLAFSTNVPAGAKLNEVAWDATKLRQFEWESPGKKPSNMNFSVFSEDRHIRNWATYTPTVGYDMSIDMSQKFNGNPSACIRSTMENPPNFGLVHQTIGAAPYRGKRIKFSGFLKTHDVSDWAALIVRIKGGTKVLGFDNMEDRPVKHDTDWKNYSIVLDVPPNADEIRYGAMLAGNGTMWINGLSLDIVSVDTPVTQPAVVNETAISTDKQDEYPKLEFQRR